MPAKLKFGTGTSVEPPIAHPVTLAYAEFPVPEKGQVAVLKSWLEINIILAGSKSVEQTEPVLASVQARASAAVSSVPQKSEPLVPVVDWIALTGVQGPTVVQTFTVVEFTTSWIIPCGRMTPAVV